MASQKFRNLLCTYRNTKQKRGQTGNGAVRWAYFSIMDAVLGCRAASLPPQRTLFCSLTSANDIPNTSQISGEHAEDDEEEEPQTESVPVGRGGISIKTYLAEKLRLAKMKETKREEARKKKISAKNDELQIKKRRVIALEALAKAFSTHESGYQNNASSL
uniref:Uncharacterized protein n=1 Tax=Cacopsylla melanoneura TaxID=428564 RepID=A0A8D8X9C2_9HEMI